jgi:hypothetical protein
MVGYLVNHSLLLIGQHSELSPATNARFPLARRICKLQTEKTITMPSFLSETAAASQSALVIDKLYAICKRDVFDESKPLTIKKPNDVRLKRKNTSI